MRAVGQGGNDGSEWFAPACSDRPAFARWGSERYSPSDPQSGSDNRVL